MLNILIYIARLVKKITDILSFCCILKYFKKVLFFKIIIFSYKI